MMKRMIQMAGVVVIATLGLVGPWAVGQADAHTGNVTCGQPGFMALVNNDPHDAVFHLPAGTVLIPGNSSDSRPVQQGSYTVDWTDGVHQGEHALPTTCGVIPPPTTAPTTTPTTIKQTHPCGDGSAPPLNIPIDEPCPGGDVVVTTAPTTEVTSSPSTTVVPVVSEPPTVPASPSIPLSTTPKASLTPSTFPSQLPSTGSDLWKKIVAIAVFFLLVGVVGVLVVRDAEKDGGQI